ncbi:MAG: Outer membrane protein, OmpA/MotB [Candidatus Magnetoglobus multicellularis str. Araruama]|uniref:Outer membrane protein, OmpA/MotB n=1 Tax=Candidatus Magnetoglobus multicellularis str. Araruama TaxID=890399 RepID=A0A1V1PDN6_9BACT|nr:MAG: Outer membrane protein, OmpA/MotB [Candidatus Magnetoglobus multicellularis str. Araruama]
MAKKKKIAPEADTSGVARGLLVSLFILLLAFFIVLNTLADEDEKRAKAVMGSVKGAFSSISGGGSLITTSNQAPSLFIDPMTTDTSLRTHKIVGLDQNSSGKVMIRVTSEGVIISMLYDLVFVEGTYDIRPSSKPFLKKICEIINQDDHMVRISGHTDSRPAQEKAVSSNWELSSLKALKLFQFFVEQGNVNPMRVSCYGRAEHDPIASNETRRTRAMNRRLDIMVDLSLRDNIKALYEKEPSSFFMFKRFVFDIFGG